MNKKKRIDNRNQAAIYMCPVGFVHARIGDELFQLSTLVPDMYQILFPLSVAESVAAVYSLFSLEVHSDDIH